VLRNLLTPTHEVQGLGLFASYILLYISLRRTPAILLNQMQKKPGKKRRCLECVTWTLLNLFASTLRLDIWFTLLARAYYSILRLYDRS